MWKIFPAGSITVQFPFVDRQGEWRFFFLGERKKDFLSFTACVFLFERRPFLRRDGGKERWDKMGMRIREKRSGFPCFADAFSSECFFEYACLVGDILQSQGIGFNRFFADRKKKEQEALRKDPLGRADTRYLSRF